jgi:hypothetical protein
MARIRKRYWVTGLIVLLVAVGAGWLLRPLPMSGPWRAQIVDAETGQPIGGVIVLAVWDKRTFAWPHPDRQYHDSEEAVSDHDGRIVIRARVVTSRHPFARFLGPFLTVFKPGYGRWQFQGTPTASGEDFTAASRRAEADRYRFAHEGVVIVMSRVRSREERKEILDGLMPVDVPQSRIPRIFAAYSQERVRLGLSPLR